MKVKLFSPDQLFATPWIVACTKLLCPWDFQGKSTGVGCQQNGRPKCLSSVRHSLSNFN